MQFWERILGFKPESEFEPVRIESKCYKCGSKKLKSIKSPSWTGKHQCRDCGYFTFAVYADFMGGALNEYVSIDKRDSDMNRKPTLEIVQLSKLVCKSCRGTNVQVRAWVDANTNEYKGESGDYGDDETWCEDCQAHNGLTREVED